MVPVDGLGLSWSWSWSFLVLYMGLVCALEKNPRDVDVLPSCLHSRALGINMFPEVEESIKLEENINCDMCRFRFCITFACLHYARRTVGGAFVPSFLSVTMSRKLVTTFEVNEYTLVY